MAVRAVVLVLGCVVWGCLDGVLAAESADKTPSDELRELFDLPAAAEPPAADVPAAGKTEEEQAAEEVVEEGPKLMGKLSIKLRSGSDPNWFNAIAEVWEGEDAAIGAFRLGEVYSLHDPEALVQLVHDLTKAIQEGPNAALGLEASKGLETCSNGRQCTAGKLLKRAEEHRKDEMYDAMGADLLRALCRTGLEDSVKDRLHRELDRAYDSVGRQRKREAKEQEKQQKIQARLEAEAAAVEESRLRKVRDEEDWSALLNALSSQHKHQSEGEVAATVRLTLTTTNSDGENQAPVSATLHHGQHPAEAAYHFCVEHGLGSHQDIITVARMLRDEAEEGGITCEPHGGAPELERAQASARSLTDDGDLVGAGAAWARALAAADNMGNEKDVERIAESLNQAMKQAKATTQFQALVVEGKWEEALEMLEEKMPRQQRGTITFLLEARCHQQMGQVQSALRAAARAVERGASHGAWTRQQPRMMAVTLGANAAMEAGSDKKAIQFYQTVLKFDPDQKEARDQYRGLKKLTKLLSKADEQVSKGKNYQAMETIDECLSALRGLDVNSPMYRSVVQLKLCRVQSSMGKHEEALETCDSVVQQRSVKVPGLFVDPRLQAEAMAARARAFMNDDDYDGAVSDCRAALNLLGDRGDTVEEVQSLLEEAQRKQDEWNGGQKDRFHPDGRPPQRDHGKILGLPVNLDTREKEVRCHWLKKQYKIKAMMWHPDKYRGNTRRGERKMREVAEAKDHLSKEWGCKIRGR